MTVKTRPELFLVYVSIVVFVAACSGINGPDIDSRRTYNESWWSYTGDLSPSGAGFHERLYLLKDQEDDWSCSVTSAYSGSTLLSRALYIGRFSGDRGKFEWIRDFDSLSSGRIWHHTPTLTLDNDSLRFNEITFARLESAMEPTPEVPVAGQFVPEKSRTGQARQVGIRMQCEKDIELTRRLGTYALQRDYNPEYFSRIKSP